MTGYVEQLQAALDAADLTVIDGPAASLALGYARALDNGGDIAKLGTPYKHALRELRLTPQSRSTGKASDDGPEDTIPLLDELRDKRRDRLQTPA